MWNNIIILLLALFCSPIFAEAQSKHTSLWYFYGNCLDFRTKPVSISPIENSCNGSYYVDGNGDVALYYDSCRKSVCDGLGNEIWHNDYQEDGNLFYIPLPNNSSRVMFFAAGRYVIVDLSHKEVVADYEFQFINLASVHNDDCSKVWLLGIKDDVFCEYAIDKYGNMELVQTIGLSDADSPFLPKADVADYLQLSADCEFYSYTNRSNEVNYGRFDRSNGSFSKLYTFRFDKFKYIFSSIISPKGDRIFYLVRDTKQINYVIEVEIVDGIPEFENYKSLASFDSRGFFPNGNFYYAYDGNVYLYYWIKPPLDLRLAQINLDENGNPDVDLDFLELTPVRNAFAHPFFMASWFLDNPCEDVTDPCAGMHKPSVMWR